MGYQQDARLAIRQRPVVQLIAPVIPSAAFLALPFNIGPDGYYDVNMDVTFFETCRGGHAAWDHQSEQWMMVGLDELPEEARFLLAEPVSTV
jgi:hypothetical protein